MNKLTEKAFVPDRCFEYAMTSRHGLDYRILLAAPADEPPPDGYAVIYVLDGDALFQTLAETVKMQTRGPKGHDPIVVVGIGYPSREPFDLERRCRDFTMPVAAASLPQRPDGRTWPAHGGADQFLDFLEHELMPAVARVWPIDPGRQAIAGHSLGGLLTLHALFARPRIFTHYAAGSPAVWWADHEVLKELDKFGQMWSREREVRVLLTIGSDELDDMRAGAQAVAERLAPLAGKGVRLDWVMFQDEEHVSVLPAMLGRLPRFIWS